MITANQLRAKWNGRDRWLSDGGARNMGRLVARLRREGATFVYQYFGPERAKKLFLLGSYDPDGVRGLSLPVARDRAAELTALYRGGVLDLHAHFERQRAEQERARKSLEEAQQRAQEEAQRATLGHLLNTYTTHLEQLGKSSAGDVKTILRKHVFNSNSALVLRKAAEISVDDFVGLIGAVVNKGKGRTAGKVRSFLRAAYALAIRSKIDPALPQAMRTFGIVVNPLASTAALSQFNGTRKRHLNVLELAAFLKRLDGVPPGAKKDDPRARRCRLPMRVPLVSFVGLRKDAHQSPIRIKVTKRHARIYAQTRWTPGSCEPQTQVGSRRRPEGVEKLSQWFAFQRGRPSSADGSA
jgi:hypothetical protein